MKTIKFKTNINCSGCVAKVTPFLDQAEGIEKWEVDVIHPDKILKVETSGLKADKIVKILEKAGFKGEVIQS
jgi:copper chaperone